jgi:hypothetical protein
MPVRSLECAVTRTFFVIVCPIYGKHGVTMPVFLRFLILLFSCSPLFAGELLFSSGNGQKTLMELYTSEGCSSCPPMERYVNRLKSDDALWESYIPVVFHVDYWNYIGWEDRFASPGFASRQRQHASEGNVPSVYTPALIVNGNGWRPGLFNQLPTLSTRSAGKLDVNINRNALTADFKPSAGGVTTLDLHIALLGMDLESRIAAGENKGRTSQHEFVVIGFKSLQSRDGHWQTRLPELHYRDTEPRALAVWVTNSSSLKPLQAVGGYLK